MTDATVRLVRDGLFLVLGLAMGSFLTVVVHRVPRHESIVSPRSRCPTCGGGIGLLENVPVASYVALKGRCRACSTPISSEYPLTEAATAALFVAASVHFASAWQAALVAPFLGVLLAISLIDARTRTIPNAIVYPSLAAFGAAILALSLVGAPVSFRDAVVGMAAYGGALGVVWFVYPKGMGLGDAKLAALIGLVLGSLGLSSVAVAAGLGIVAGGIGGVVSLAMGRGRKDAIPFGPFLAAGAGAAAFVGPAIAGWYTGLLG